ncbi:MAG TPA: hypothetical protein DEA43_01615 [Candidatus Moranbacteria bacterium]|nr:hypothetical protein [Candidatus Moranbacteria bacterium]HBT45565.1 hypothetical protein [Candidatus Moranbacteria bacterium]
MKKYIILFSLNKSFKFKNNLNSLTFVFLFAILSAELFFGFSDNARAATITTAQTGDYSATSTWVGGVLPDPALDTVVVAVGHTLTLDDTRSIPATTIEGSLTQGTGVVTTLAGVLTIGNGTGKNGTFTFGAGSTLAMETFNVALNNCNLRSNSVSDNWAVVTGTGAWLTGAITGPTQDVQLSYVSFQHTGVFTLSLRTTTGSLTNLVDLSHAAFIGTGAITIGTAGWTSPTVPVTIEYSDFRNTSTIIFYNTSTDPVTSRVSIEYNTFSVTSSIAFPRKATVQYNVFDQSAVINANAGINMLVRDNLFIQRNVASGSSAYTITSTTLASDNYFYSPSSQLNSHAIQTSTGTATASNNIFEFWGTEPNIINYQPNSNLTVNNNIAFGAGNISLVTVGSNSTSGFLTITNNTQKCNNAAASGLLLVENTSHTGSITTVKNNLVIPVTSNPYLIVANVPTNTINIASSDYNAMPGTQLSSYKEIDSVGDRTHEIYDFIPTLLDSTRSFATWGSAIAGTDGTDIALIDKFLAINGYNSTTKIQSNQPSGLSIIGTPTSLIDWVRYGFTPTSTELKAAGEGGVDIGAVSVADTAAPTDTTISINSNATATNSATVTLTLSATDSFGVTQMKFSNDNITYADPVAYATEASHTLSAGNGTKTVYVKYGDAANNWSNAVSDEIILDTISPTTSANISTGTFNVAQDVTLTCDDGTGSGCDKIYYTTDNSDPTTSSTQYTAPINIPTTTTLKYFSQDLATNSETINSQTYTIDTAAPNTTITDGPEALTNAVAATFQFDATETATFQCKIDGETFASCESPKEYTSLAEGEHTFYVKAIDSATNEDLTPASFTWNIDITAPTTTPSIEGGTFDLAQSLTLSCADNLADCDKIYYTTDGSIPTTSSQVFSGTLVINATTTLKFFSQDLLGNSETPKTQIYTINTQQTDDNQTILIPTPKLFSNDNRKSFSTILKSNKVKLSSTIVDLRGGNIKITNGSKTIKEVSIDEFGKWNANFKAKKFRIHYLNASGEEVSISKQYKLKIDDEKPEIKPLAPLYIKHRGSIISWQASDNRGVHHFSIAFGNKKIKTKKSQVTVPSSVKKGLQTFTITAYDKAGNKTSQKGNLVVTW